MCKTYKKVKEEEKTMYDVNRFRESKSDKCPEMFVKERQSEKVLKMYINVIENM